jgi:PTS system nitrogen regulatory IIA component
MKPILNQLIQLQELCFALSERQAGTSKSQLSQLESSIAAMKRKLPDELEALFEQLHTKSPLFVAPVVAGACTACRQTLPTSLDFSVRTHGDQLHQCPHCRRIIYSPEGSIRKTRRRIAAFGRPTTGVSQYSASALMIPQLASKARNEAIAEVVALMAQQGFIEDPETLTELALRREAIDSTAVEHGLAFPHVRGIEGGGLTLALGMKKGGIDFGAPDKKLTRIIFFSVIPTAASAFYLKLLSGLIQTFRETDARKRLLASSTPEEAWENLTSLTGQTIK